MSTLSRWTGEFRVSERLSRLLLCLAPSQRLLDGGDLFGNSRLHLLLYAIDIYPVQPQERRQRIAALSGEAADVVLVHERHRYHESDGVLVEDIHTLEFCGGVPQPAPGAARSPESRSAWREGLMGAPPSILVMRWARRRKRIEQYFGRLKTVALLCKLRHRGIANVDWIFTFAFAVDNPLRLRNLTAVISAV